MSWELGLDKSGNENNWTANNITMANQMVDSPTNNFCTMNPLTHGSAATYQEGNLRIETPNYPFSKGTFQVSAGKWYWEWTHHDGTYNTYTGIGNDLRVAVNESHNVANTQAWFGNESRIKKWSGTSGVVTGTLAISDIIGIAVDLDNGSIKFYKNGVLVDTDTTLPAGTAVTPLLGGSNDGTSGSGWGDITFNFGADSSFAGFKTAQGNQDGNDIGDFYYTPPTGFLALCTSNLPDVAVIPSEHFNTVLYSGNSSTNAITGVGFQPDFTWLKVRDIADVHALFDSVRGVNKRLYSNGTNAEMTGSNQLDSWGTDGFTLGADGAGQVNLNTKSYVAWNWKANGSGSSNTNGSINSTVSANVDAGFSIVSYTGNGVDGATIGHGLSKAPEMVIVKSRTDAVNWFVYHKDVGTNKYLLLDTTTAANTDNDTWNNTAPSSSLITFGGQYQTVGNNKNLIAYAFHSVDGYSKVGSYTGNGSTDGTFVYTGFRPAFVMMKRTNASGQGWPIQNNKSNPYNMVNKRIDASESFSENTSSSAGGYGVDYVSNGFKIRNTNVNWNASAGTYIYIAFAEQPFKYSNAR